MLEMMERERGHYLGTEIDGKWHRRYREDGLFARGLGEYWIEDGALRFRRFLTKTPFSVPLRSVRKVELGRWHAGRWVGSERAIKLIWEHRGKVLSSGFVFTRTPIEAAQRARELRDSISRLVASRDAAAS
jgi:hypothetical protein